MLKPYNLNELQGYSNKAISKLIYTKIKSDKSDQVKILSISNDIKYINDREVLDKVLQSLNSNGLFKQPNSQAEYFKRNLYSLNYSDKENTIFEALFYSLFFKNTINIITFFSTTGKQLPELITKVRSKNLYHNFDDVLEYYKKRTILFYIDYANKLPSKEKEDFLLMMKNSALNSDYLNNSETYIDEVRLLKEHINSKIQTTIKDDKDHIWFKVGLCFAKGKAQELYKKVKTEKGHFKKITLELGFKPTDRPYFSETISNSHPSDKNIYSDFKKLDLIHRHCLKDKISLADDFITAYNKLKPF